MAVVLPTRMACLPLRQGEDQHYNRLAAEHVGMASNKTGRPGSRLQPDVSLWVPVLRSGMSMIVRLTR